jgi:hypothetical protein
MMERRKALMEIGKMEGIKDPVIAAFLRLIFLFGQLEGINIVGKGPEEARKIVLSEIKALREAFSLKDKKPGERAALQLEMMLDELKEEMDLVEADPEVLKAMMEVNLFPGPGELH